MNVLEIIHFRSLRGMITMIILIVVAVSVALTAWVLGMASETMLERAVEARTRLTANLALQGVREAMLNGTPWRLHSTIQRMQSVESIYALRIIDPAGKIKYDADEADIGTLVDLTKFKQHDDGSTVSYFTGMHDGRPMLEGLLPIKVEPECRQCHQGVSPIIGYLNVETDMNMIGKQIADFRAISFASMILTVIGVGVTLSVLLALLVTKPLQRLERRMKASAEYVRTLHPDADLELTGAVVPVEVEYEVGKVAESFNELLSVLERSHREIQRLHNADMERAAKMATIGELASSIAHEIRNPLAGILGAVEVISEDLAEDHPKRAVTDMIKSEIQRLNRTLTNLLSFARPRPLDFKRTHIDAVAEKAIAFVRERAARQRVDLTYEAARNLPEVIADEDGIMQVVMNILLNALDAMPEGGPLSLTLVSEAREVKLVIRDNGPGMSEQALASLFKPFFTTKVKGTGLGLAISKRIIDSHHGTFAVASLPGSGTTVTITLPVAHDA